VVADRLDWEFPDLRRDCVVGPEKVVREAAREYLAEERESTATAD
jgi:cysteine desulfurase/selenocysteine lyase